ncbi:MAG: hypothetical protein WCW47_01315 [Candidatus Paceibacterota bacterium]|jgi:hypothetical protein
MSEEGVQPASEDKPNEYDVFMAEKRKEEDAQQMQGFALSEEINPKIKILGELVPRGNMTPRIFTIEDRFMNTGNPLEVSIQRIPGQGDNITFTIKMVLEPNQVSQIIDAPTDHRYELTQEFGVGGSYGAEDSLGSGLTTLSEIGGNLVFTNLDKARVISNRGQLKDLIDEVISNLK